MTKRTIVVGTGFLGMAVVQILRQSGARPLHTFRRHQSLQDSIRFDLTSQSLSDVVSLSEIGTVIFTAKLEDSADCASLRASMRTFFHDYRDLRIVFLSSDAVFDGRKGMYVESDSRNPQTPYGRLKAACEDILMAHVPNHCIIRPSYIYGVSCGQLDPRLLEARTAMRNGVPYRRFVDMYKSPIEVNQLAGIVVKASCTPFLGVLHAGGERVSVYDFFRKSLMAMGESIRHLVPENLPENPPAECLLDTSLDCRLLAETFGYAPDRAYSDRTNF
jgi:dTDP-4-dehydrorhamnose reductase